MPRYEIKKLFSRRFWEIDLHEDRFTITEGKVGTPGKTKKHAFGDRASALHAYNLAMNAQVDAGWTHVSHDPQATFDPPKIRRAKEQPVVVAKEAFFAPANPELERAIFIGREDVAAWQVFGDWLESQGDPRGKAIALSFANGPDAERALDEHIATYAASWFGSFYEWYAESYGVTRNSSARAMVEWRHGFLYDVRLAASRLGGNEVNCAPLLESFLEAPVARFLHSLAIGLYIVDDENDYAGLAALLDGRLPMLRKLEVGDTSYEESMISASYIPDIDHLLRALPSLHELIVTGAMSASSLEHAELRSLALESGGIGREMSPVIGAARFPKLERLEVWTGQEDYGWYGPLSDYAPLLSGATCPKLTHLGFRNSEQADDFVNVLAESALLPRLKTLDLSKGALTPRGARNLIEHKAKYAHLERLNVSECCLGEEVVRELSRHYAADVLIAKGQREPVSFAQWDAAVLRMDEREAMQELGCYTDVGE